jgi:hypothetical protein
MWGNFRLLYCIPLIFLKSIFNIKAVIVRFGLDFAELEAVESVELVEIAAFYGGHNIRHVHQDLHSRTIFRFSSLHPDSMGDHLHVQAVVAQNPSKDPE